jgi:hypothetical protein
MKQILSKNMKNQLDHPVQKMVTGSTNEVPYKMSSWDRKRIITTIDENSVLNNTSNNRTSPMMGNVTAIHQFLSDVQITSLTKEGLCQAYT